MAYEVQTSLTLEYEIPSKCLVPRGKVPLNSKMAIVDKKRLRQTQVESRAINQLRKIMDAKSIRINDIMMLSGRLKAQYFVQ